MPVLWCFSFTLFNVEEFRGKKRRRKERKRDRVRASYLWTSDVSATALAQPLSLLHALWSHEVKKEDWPFLPRIHAQGFALFINFLSTCVQTVGAPFVHYFYCNWMNLFKILLSQKLQFLPLLWLISEIGLNVYSPITEDIIRLHSMNYVKYLLWSRHSSKQFIFINSPFSVIHWGEHSSLSPREGS